MFFFPVRDLKRIWFYASPFRLCDLVVKTLGFDWVLALFTPGAHHATVVLGLRVLLALLKHDHLMQKFKGGSANGGWLTDADSFVRNRAAVISYSVL